jgi:hypothetical protein
MKTPLWWGYRSIVVVERQKLHCDGDAKARDIVGRYKVEEKHYTIGRQKIKIRNFTLHNGDAMMEM